MPSPNTKPRSSTEISARSWGRNSPFKYTVVMGSRKPRWAGMSSDQSGLYVAVMARLSRAPERAVGAARPYVPHASPMCDRGATESWWSPMKTAARRECGAHLDAALYNPAMRITAALLTVAALALAGSPSRADSTSPVIGKPAPDFTLKDLAGSEVKLASYKGKVVVLEWFNPGCPFVKRSHTVGSLVDTAKRHTKNGVVWLAINSGAPGKQGADLAANTEAVKTWSMEHPVLK